jgi:hypothetical protein
LKSRAASPPRASEFFFFFFVVVVVNALDAKAEAEAAFKCDVVVVVEGADWPSRPLRAAPNPPPATESDSAPSAKSNLGAPNAAAACARVVTEGAARCALASPGTTMVVLDLRTTCTRMRARIAATSCIAACASPALSGPATRTGLPSARADHAACAAPDHASSRVDTFVTPRVSPFVASSPAPAPLRPAAAPLVAARVVVSATDALIRSESVAT